MVGVALHPALLRLGLPPRSPCQTAPAPPAHPPPPRNLPHPVVRGLPRMNGPALFALFPEMPPPRALALADVSPAPLSDALRFILSSRQDTEEPFSLSKSASFLTRTQPASLTWGCVTQLLLLFPLPPPPPPPPGGASKVLSDKEPQLLSLALIRGSRGMSFQAAYTGYRGGQPAHLKGANQMQRGHWLCVDAN